MALDGAVGQRSCVFGPRTLVEGPEPTGPLRPIGRELREGRVLMLYFDHTTTPPRLCAKVYLGDQYFWLVQPAEG